MKNVVLRFNGKNDELALELLREFVKNNTLVIMKAEVFDDRLGRFQEDEIFVGTLLETIIVSK